MNAPEDAAEIWRRIAPWWDAVIGEGNEFQTQLIIPATDRLLGVQAGEKILDLACGNGNYTRRLGKSGANVLGVDVAEAFIVAARKRTTPADGNIQYCVGDLTDEAVVSGLGKAGEFDAAVCSMALMDLPVIVPVIRGLRKLLRVGGRFVFSVPHPCFNSARVRMTAELINEDGRLEQVYGVAIQSYIREEQDLSSGILNQPEPHYLFHRPLTTLINTFAKEGFVMNGLEEPTFKCANGGGGKNAFSWKMRAAIPPALVGRFVAGKQ